MSHLPLFIDIDYFDLNIVCDWFCAETIHFFVFCPISSTGISTFFAFSAVVVIHLTHHHSGVNTELTNAQNLTKSFFFFS